MLPNLNQAQCQQARLARDPRFDGQFFVAVKTTGIFCRPICPANLPKEDNVEYFQDKTQALNAGYRPCLRCRPDSAPSSWAWKGTETTFQRALAWLDQHGLQDMKVGQLADKLGISERYLRQLFQQYLGLSPKQYDSYQRLLFAKTLLHNSQFSIQDIAYAAGFNSTRRFFDAFQKQLKLTPGQIRRQPVANPELTLQLPFQGQINWPHLLEFYRTRQIEGIESVDEHSYQRYFTFQGHFGWLRVCYNGGQALTVTLRFESLQHMKPLIKHIRRLFDLDANTDVIEAHLSEQDRDVVHLKGLRIPGVWDTWEAGVRAILGQQVSVKAAIGQLNLLVNTLCDPSHDEKQFPRPQQVASADLSFLKMPQSRKETLARFAKYLCDNPDSAPEQWLALKGIGPWTVNYAKLRGLSATDCFLHTDLIIKKRLVNKPHLTPESLSPWGSYATFHLWSHP